MSLWDGLTSQQDFHFPVCLSCLCPIRHKILGMLCKNPPFTKTTDPAPPFTKTTDSALCNEALVDQLWKLMNSGETDRDTWDTHTHTHTCAPDRMFNPLFKPRTALSNGGAVVASTVAKANRPPLKRRAVILCVRNVVNTLCHQKQKGTSCLCPSFLLPARFTTCWSCVDVFRHNSSFRKYCLITVTRTGWNVFEASFIMSNQAAGWVLQGSCVFVLVVHSIHPKHSPSTVSL